MINRKKFEDIIWFFPMMPLYKFKLIKKVNQLYFTFKGKSNENANVALISSNEYYGHEYWLKKFSNYNKSICGVIEHGLYFGNNTNKVTGDREYILKNIITFGDYRSEIIKRAFPEYGVYAIGPRIAYAETDANFLKELRSESNGKKVLTLFPAHSLSQCKCEYDLDYLLSKAKQVMERKKIGILRVCLKEQDIVNGTSDMFKDRGCHIVTAGSASINFLPRLRAIIESSSIAMSNSLGTNLGYCVYLNKPYYLIAQDKNNVECNDNSEIYKTYKKEEERFIKAFDINNAAEITKEQLDLCDYYWGFKYVKNPSELNDLFKHISKRGTVK